MRITGSSFGNSPRFKNKFDGKPENRCRGFNMNRVALVSNGDFRDPVGLNCWPMQEKTLSAVERAFEELGVETYRANPFKKDKRSRCTSPSSSDRPAPLRRSVR